MVGDRSFVYFEIAATENHFITKTVFIGEIEQVRIGSEGHSFKVQIFLPFATVSRPYCICSPSFNDVIVLCTHLLSMKAFTSLPMVIFSLGTQAIAKTLSLVVLVVVKTAKLLEH